jgi:hypothetical protein
VAEVQRLVAAQPESADAATHLAYLAKRTAHVQYPTFLAAGWPIGDGAVESGNKLVVEARLKGSGARPHVDPMLALRNIVCSDRWDEAWPQIVSTLRQQVQQRRPARRSGTIPPTVPLPSAAPLPPPAPKPSVPLAQAQPNQPSCPPANHP